MKKQVFSFVSAFLFCLACGLVAISAFSGCGLQKQQNGEKESGKPLTLEEKADRMVSKMSDSQKIGQLMMIGIKSTDLDKDATYMMTEYPCGNVILFDRNMKTPDQVKALNESITRTVKKQTGLAPLIAVDQEGGMVARMTDYLPAMPSAETLGQGSTADAKAWAVKTGKALKDLGFNTNFAPVVDLDGAYHRSYGKTPEAVVPFAKAVIDGYTETGLHTSLKHFPGIGKVKTDPHIDGDVVNITREGLDREDGKPFRDLISQMDSRKTFVMVSNVTFPAIDPANPACLSKTIMTDILRNGYGFQGLILTDDMEMGAMAKHYAFADMGVKAIEAGADMVLVCHEYDHEQAVYNGLLKAYRSGALDRKLVDEKVKRIVMVKLADSE